MGSFLWTDEVTYEDTIAQFFNDLFPSTIPSLSTILDPNIYDDHVGPVVFSYIIPIILTSSLFYLFNMRMADSSPMKYQVIYVVAIAWPSMGAFLIMASYLLDTGIVKSHSSEPNPFENIVGWLSGWQFELPEASNYCRLDLIDSAPTNFVTHRINKKIDRSEAEAVKKSVIFFGVLSEISTILLVCITGTVVNMYLGVCLVVIMIAHSLVRKEVDAVDFVEVNDGESRPLGLSDGTYIVRVFKNGFASQYGRAVVWKGVLHAPYHVVGSNCQVVTKSGLRKPTHQSSKSDLVTWGGRPQTVEPVTDDQIYYKYVDGNGNEVGGESIVDVHKGIALIHAMRSQPGMSGTPMFKRTIDSEGNVKWDLVQLAGNFYMDSNVSASDYKGNQTKQIEILNSVSGADISGSINVDVGGFFQVFEAPGRGKTHRIMPSVLSQAISKGWTAVVAAPTNMICRDMASLLLDKFPNQVSSHFRTGVRDINASISVYPHAFLVNNIFNESIQFSAKTLFVIDETHSNNAETMFLNRYLRDMVGLNNPESANQNCLVEMTATGYDVMKKCNVLESRNDLITDKQFNLTPKQSSTAPAICTEVMSMINSVPVNHPKVIIFCPNRNSRYGVNSIVKGLKSLRIDADIIPFHRKVYSANYDQATSPPDGRMKIVVSTNIAEVGVNLGADVCIDFQLCMDFTRVSQTAYIFKSRIVKTSAASMAQRRGRVGRAGKAGFYFHMGPKSSDDHMYFPKSEAVFAANIYSKSFGLTCYTPFDSVGEEIPFLSREQIKAHMKSDSSSLAQSVVQYDIAGKKRSHQAQIALLRSWKNDPNSECVSLSGLKIAPKLLWFDSRSESFFTKLIGEMENVIVDEVNDSGSEEEADLNDIKPPVKFEKPEKFVPGTKFAHDIPDHSSCVVPHSHVCDCGVAFTHKHELPDDHLIVDCPEHRKSSAKGYLGIFGV